MQKRQVLQPDVSTPASWFKSWIGRSVLIGGARDFLHTRAHTRAHTRTHTHTHRGMVPQIVNTTVFLHFLATSLFSDRPFMAWERPEMLTVTLNEPQRERFWPLRKASFRLVVMGHGTQEGIKRRVEG
jgi:hypothetical protein